MLSHMSVCAGEVAVSLSTDRWGGAATFTCASLPVPGSYHCHSVEISLLPKKIRKMSLFLSTRTVQWVRSAKEIINVFVFLCLTFKQCFCFFFWVKAPFSFLFVLKLLLNLCPFLNHNLLSPVNQFYNLPFPRIINIFRPVFIFPDFFFFQRVYLSVIYLYICGEGNGTPLQYSCRKNPMDGGAWWAAVHGVAKSRTRLSDFTFTFQFHALEKEMATHSSVLAWRIPGTGEPGGLPSMGSHKAGHDWSDLAAAASVYMCVIKNRYKNIFVSIYVFVLFFNLHVSFQNFLFI